MTQPKEVLVVEDEALTRMVAADAIVDAGIPICEAGDVAEALQVLEEHPNVGLLFTDVNMPGDGDGLELAQKVVDARPDIQLIVTSGAMALTDEQLPDHGTFLPKPYSTARLVEIVQAKLNLPKPS
jgi:CheY-like chemotaxis protein